MPGRVLLISHKTHINKLAILLSVTTKKEVTSYKVLVLSDAKKESDINSTLSNLKIDDIKNTDQKNDEWFKMISFGQDEIFQPDGIGGHEVLEIISTDILEITTKNIKVDANLVIQDWEKRQIPRFRDDPPGQTCYQAIQELTKITQIISADQNNAFLTESDYHIKDIDLNTQFHYLKNKKNDLNAHKQYTRIANFEEQFAIVFKRKQLEEKVDHLKFMISHQSLTLYPEYLSRIKVLQEFRYINDQNRGNYLNIHH